MDSNNSTPKILPEVQNDVSKFFDTKIGILEGQEKRLEKLLLKVRSYSTSYKISKERALSSFLIGVPAIEDQKLPLTPLELENVIKEEGKPNSNNTDVSIPTKIEQKHLVSEETNEESTVLLSSDLIYDKNWNHSQKVQYVVMEPQKYGFKTFEGSNSVVDAILSHEPEWLKRESRMAILAKIAPTISKLVKRRKLVKLRVMGSKAEFHYISRRWYDYNGIIKPEYKVAIAQLEIIAPEKKLPPVGAGGSVESETTIGEKPSIDAAEKLNGHSYGLLSNSNSF